MTFGAAAARTAAISAASTALALLLAVPLAAQQTPVFRTGSGVVTVDVSVLDKQGRPVSTLTPADFEVREDGSVRPIDAVYLVVTENARGTAATAASPTPSASSALPIITRPRIFVFVIDQAHLSPDGFKRSVAAIDSFLKDTSLPPDIVGIVSAGVMLTNKLATDRAPLLQALKTIPGPRLARIADLREFPRLIDEGEASNIARNDDRVLDAALLRACTEQPDDCNRMGREVIRQQIAGKGRRIASESLADALASLQTLQTLAASLGKIPGTKQVLVFSEGFPINDVQSRLQSVVKDAAKNNVRFSTLDSRGLAKDARMRNLMNAQPLMSTSDMAVPFDEQIDVLSSLAVDTGGDLVEYRNDLRPGIDLITRTTSSYYVVGFTPQKPLDGGYHAISVRVQNADLTVRARKGYIAEAQPNAPAMPALAARTETPTPSVIAAAPTAVAPPPTTPPTAVPATPPSAPVEAAAPVVPIESAARASSRVEALTRLQPSSASNAAGGLADEGWQAYTRGDIDAARDRFERALASGETALWVSYALGLADFAGRRYDSAATAWSAVRNAVPEFMPVYFNLADAHLGRGRAADAISVLRDAAKRWPNEPEAQNALATQLVKRGALDEAVVVLVHITTVKPDDSLGFFNLGRAYQLRYMQVQSNAIASGLGKTSLGDDDRKRAIAALEQYLRLGGPYESQARAVLQQLSWK